MEHRLGGVSGFVGSRRPPWDAVSAIFGVGISFSSVISPGFLARGASDIDCAHFGSVDDLVCRIHHIFRITTKAADEAFQT